MAAKPCPICGKSLIEAGPEAAAAAKHVPFCSSRCKDVDLHRWLTGRYAIPAVEQDDSEATEAAPDGDRTLH